MTKLSKGMKMTEMCMCSCIMCMRCCAHFADMFSGEGKELVPQKG